MAGNTVPTPPRLTGEYGQDATQIASYMTALYKALVLSNEFLKSAGQTDTGDFDPSSLPDPGKTNLAQAQDTANKAYELAAIANSQANIMDLFGEVVLGGGDSFKSVVFTESQVLPDDNFSVVLTAKSFTGSPPAGALVIAQITQTKEQFTVWNSVPSGVGNSVTFNWHLRRDTSQST